MLHLKLRFFFPQQNLGRVKNVGLICDQINSPVRQMRSMITLLLNIAGLNKLLEHLLSQFPKCLKREKSNLKMFVKKDNNYNVFSG